MAQNSDLVNFKDLQVFSDACKESFKTNSIHKKGSFTYFSFKLDPNILFSTINAFDSVYILLQGSAESNMNQYTFNGIYQFFFVYNTILEVTGTGFNSGDYAVDKVYITRNQDTTEFVVDMQANCTDVTINVVCFKDGKSLYYKPIITESEIPVGDNLIYLSTNDEDANKCGLIQTSANSVPFKIKIAEISGSPVYQQYPANTVFDTIFQADRMSHDISFSYTNEIIKEGDTYNVGDLREHLIVPKPFVNVNENSCVLRYEIKEDQHVCMIKSSLESQEYMIKDMMSCYQSYTVPIFLNSKCSNYIVYWNDTIDMSSNHFNVKFIGCPPNNQIVHINFIQGEDSYWPLYIDENIFVNNTGSANYNSFVTNLFNSQISDLRGSVIMKQMESFEEDTSTSVSNTHFIQNSQYYSTNNSILYDTSGNITTGIALTGNDKGTQIDMLFCFANISGEEHFSSTIFDYSIVHINSLNNTLIK